MTHDIRSTTLQHTGKASFLGSHQATLCRTIVDQKRDKVRLCQAFATRAVNCAPSRSFGRLSRRCDGTRTALLYSTYRPQQKRQLLRMIAVQSHELVRTQTSSRCRIKFPSPLYTRCRKRLPALPVLRLASDLGTRKGLLCFALALVSLIESPHYCQSICARLSATK